MSGPIFVATRKGLFRLDRSASSTGPGWAIAQTAFVGDPVSMVLPDPVTGRIYAAIGHGHFGVKLHRSEDGGVTWAECAAPKYPARPEGAPEDRCPTRGIPIPWNVELIWSLETGGRDQPGVL